MFDLQVTQTAMELLPLVCVSLLTWSGTTFAAENETKVIKVEIGSDAILPCSTSGKQDISSEMFEWKKDGNKRVFLRSEGLYYEDIPGQDQQFRGRVSHFPDELKPGDASITIRDTKVADSGVYTCEFPNLKPSQIFHIKLLVVGGNLKDRTGENIPGSALKPSITSLKQTKDWARLQCETHGNPQPELLWQDSDGNNLKAEEPQVSTQGDQFYVTLQITVNKTDLYRCVATQDEIRHQIHEETHVYINAEVKPGSSTAWIVAGIFAVLFVVVLVVLVCYCISQNRKKNGGVDYKTSPEEEA